MTTGTFAIGSRDMDALEFSLRIVQHFTEVPWKFRQTRRLWTEDDACGGSQHAEMQCEGGGEGLSAKDRC